MIKINDLKKELKELNQKQLIQLIVDLYKANKEVKQLLSTKFNGEEAVEVLFQEAKQKVKNEFFPERGDGKLRLTVAKKAILDFKKLTNDQMRTVDLLLYYVEMGTDFTDSFGDIDESFYNNMITMYDKVISACAADETFYHAFEERLYKVVELAERIGWGYGDAIADLYYTVYYSMEDEQEE
ncbi:hypothetical protein GNT69_03525 [Bacillus sp. B15-48]|nr:hypothetical protein [Bacillus sp. B15-48]